MIVRKSESKWPCLGVSQGDFGKAICCAVLFCFVLPALHCDEVWSRRTEKACCCDLVLSFICGDIFCLISFMWRSHRQVRSESRSSRVVALVQSSSALAFINCFQESGVVKLRLDF